MLTFTLCEREQVGSQGSLYHTANPTEHFHLPQKGALELRNSLLSNARECSSSPNLGATNAQARQAASTPSTPIDFSTETGPFFFPLKSILVPATKNT